MYIAETLINPIFTDVAFHRDSEGDGLGHYESGWVMSPPSLVPSVRLHFWYIICASIAPYALPYAIKTHLNIMRLL